MKYVLIQNNTFVWCIFGPFLGNGWTNWISSTINKVIIDHNTIYNIDGAHGPTTMFSRARKIQFTNNLYINGTLRPQESFSNKWIDFAQNTEIDSAKIGKWGPGKSKYWGVITKLGPSAIWLISIEMVDSAGTKIDMHANNISWTKTITDVWTAKGLKKPPIWSYETSKAMLDSTKAYFEEELTFVNAPAVYMPAVNCVADSCVKMQAKAPYKSPPSPYAGWTNYDGNGDPLYDLRTKANMNFAYDWKSKSYSAGDLGYPLGDLNWWGKEMVDDFNIGIIYDYFGPPDTSSVEDKAVQVDVFTLSQNYPNPFNPTTRISYVLTQSGKVNLTIYDMLGKAVKTLVNESQSAGRYSYQVDASDLSSGIYFYTLTTANEIVTKKMALVR